MESREFLSETWDWIVSARGKRYLDLLEEPALSLDDLERRVRRELGEDQAAMILEQRRLRAKAGKRFFNPTDWIFEAKLMEQASDQRSAELVASYFPKSVPVVDLCCGMGVDAVALAAGRSSITCIDSSPASVTLTRFHLDQHRLKGTVEQSRAEDIAIDSTSWVHCDPDRRATGGRASAVEFSSPDEEFLLNLIERTPGGSIKLAPAAKLSEAWNDQVGLEWIGWDRSVRQQRAWWGVDDFPAGTRTLSVLSSQQHWHHFRVTEAQVIDNFSAIQPLPDQPAYLGDTDPTVRAAGMNASIASECGATVVGDEHGYLCSDKPTPSLFVDWFRVIDTSSLDSKKLRKMIRSHNIGSLEIKKRGVDLDPEKLRREFKLNGDLSATLILLREGERRLAFLTQREP